MAACVHHEERRLAAWWMRKGQKELRHGKQQCLHGCSFYMLYIYTDRSQKNTLQLARFLFETETVSICVNLINDYVFH